MTFLEIFQVIMTCISPIIIAWFGYSANKNEKQTKKYKKHILKNHHANTISLEMLSTYGWGKYAKHNIGVDCFGRSGKAKDVIHSFNFDKEAILNKLDKIIK